MQGERRLGVGRFPSREALESSFFSVEGGESPPHRPLPDDDPDAPDVSRPLEGVERLTGLHIKT